MKITRITPLVLGTAWRDLTFLKVETDEGLTGVGEARSLNHTDAVLGYLKEAGRNHILGSDPFEVESLVNRMVRSGELKGPIVIGRDHLDAGSVASPFRETEAMLDGSLSSVDLEWSPDYCLGICAVSGRAIKPLSSGGGGERPGYPGEHYTNMPISGLEKVDPDILVYHNGTAFGAEGADRSRLFTTGGRVLTLVAHAETLAEARSKAYDNIKRIRFNGMRYRKDIGLGYV